LRISSLEGRPEPLRVIKRHLFLIIAIAVLGLMAVAGGVRMLMPAKGAAGGAPAAGAQARAGGGAGPRGAGGGRGAQAVVVKLTQVGQRPFVERIEVLGVAKARQSVTLTASTTELVTRIRFKSGDYVRQGQVLADLNARQQNADIIQAQAALDLAKSNLDRWQSLADRGVAPKATAEQYKSQYEQARAVLASRKAGVDDRTIRAPFSGVVGLTDAAPGMLVNPGATIATLDDVSVIRVDFPIAERYLSVLREGLPLTATADAYPAVTFRGRIANLDSRIDPGTRSIVARAEFPNANRLLKPGMLLHVSLDQTSRTNPAVPESAVVFEAKGAYVYGLGHDPKKGPIAVRKDIVVGSRGDGWIEVVSGLDVGDKVVAEGVNRVRANEGVRPVGDGPDSMGKPAGAPAPRTGAERAPA
jgi:membrane fusion protein (multidrug efflux system)